MSLEKVKTLDNTEPLELARSAGMQLDARQRAMLEAMGITVWTGDFLTDKTPLDHKNSAQPATKIIVQSEALAMRNTKATPPSIASAPTPTLAPTSAPHQAVPPRAAAPAPATRPTSNPTALQPLPVGIAQMDWQQLQVAVSTCQACSLCEGRKNAVFGMGQPSTEPALAPRADWLIVGEAPSENEDTQGEPFVGEAGKLLDNMLRAMLIDGQPLARQHNVFISNVLKCRPLGDRNPSDAEVAMCQPYLHRQIALLQPRIILAMGRFAVQALTGSTEPLGKLRGRVHALHGGHYAAPVIVTYHPAYLLRNLPDKAKAWADLLLAMQTLADSIPAPTPA
jgi:uracil-DNA glycosylase